MKIGELAEQSGVQPRMLRYYEKRGLLEPEREANGYRTYGPHQVERVKRIRSLVDSGVPLNIVAHILPCIGEQVAIQQPWPELREMLVDQRDKMTKRADALLRNRDALTAYIAAMDQRASAATSTG